MTAVCCITDGHEQAPAVAVFVYYGPRRDPRRTAALGLRRVPGARLWPHGPGVVELGSARHAELHADPDPRTV